MEYTTLVQGIPNAEIPQHWISLTCLLGQVTLASDSMGGCVGSGSATEWCIFFCQFG